MPEMGRSRFKGRVTGWGSDVLKLYEGADTASSEPRGPSVILGRTGSRVARFLGMKVSLGMKEEPTLPVQTGKLGLEV